MKKLLVALLTAVLTVSFVGTVMAGDGLITMDEEEPAEELIVSEAVSSIDISFLSIEDLVVLKKLISLEINKRAGVLDDVIGIGAYVVGRDIKPGVFAITVSDDSSGSFKLYDSETKYADGEESTWENVWPNNIFTVNLHEGMVLELLGVYGTIVEQSGASWAP